jgi:hypothetical protein
VCGPARRLEKKLKGRVGAGKGPDDGLGMFFETLPGLELFDDGKDYEKLALAAATKKAAAAGLS